MDIGPTERYRTPEGARAYREKYERSWFRRLSHRREMALVAGALRAAEAGGVIVDCPCGTGRLFETLVPFADRILAFDRETTMVEEARARLKRIGSPIRIEVAVAGIEALPLGAGAADGIVCHRLLHHVATAEERAPVWAALRRVARRFVVVSFQDATTSRWKRRVRKGRVGHRVAFTPEALAAEALGHGLVPGAPPRRLGGLVSPLAVAWFRPEDTDRDEGP